MRLLRQRNRLLEVVAVRERGRPVRQREEGFLVDRRVDVDGPLVDQVVERRGGLAAGAERLLETVRVESQRRRLRLVTEPGRLGLRVGRRGVLVVAAELVRVVFPGVVPLGHGDAVPVVPVATPTPQRVGRRVAGPQSRLDRFRVEAENRRGIERDSIPVGGGRRADGRWVDVRAVDDGEAALAEQLARRAVGRRFSGLRAVDGAPADDDVAVADDERSRFGGPVAGDGRLAVREEGVVDAGRPDHGAVDRVDSPLHRVRRHRRHHRYLLVQVGRGGLVAVFREERPPRVHAGRGGLAGRDRRARVRRRGRALGVRSLHGPPTPHALKKVSRKYPKLITGPPPRGDRRVTPPATRAVSPGTVGFYSRPPQIDA